MNGGKESHYLKSAFKARIVAREEVAPDHVELLLSAEELAGARAGQFCHVLTPGMLRRPLSFSRIDPKKGEAGILLQVVGSGTAWLYDQHVGEELDLLGPLGQGFEEPNPELPWLLVGGGVGIPPLYAALQSWQASMKEPIAAILGARTATAIIMVEDFRERGIYPLITTDDGSLGRFGTVVGPFVEWMERYPSSQVMACGPTPMLAALQGAGKVQEGFLQLCMEQRMGCGVGACLACVVPARPIGEDGPCYRRVCTEGPVFHGEELVF